MAAGVPHFGGVSFKSVYRGVDAVYYGAESTMEYDFDVAPGVDPSVIRMHFPGAKRVSLDPSGDLLIDAGRRHPSDEEARGVPGDRRY